MVPLPLSYNLFATNCAKEVISAAVPLEEGLSGSEMTAIGAEQLATHITDLQTKLRIEQTEQGRIALVGCETDKPSSSLPLYLTKVPSLL
jgi:hypothetical protein